MRAHSGSAAADWLMSGSAAADWQMQGPAAAALTDEHAMAESPNRNEDSPAAGHMVIDETPAPDTLPPLPEPEAMSPASKRKETTSQSPDSKKKKKKTGADADPAASTKSLLNSGSPVRKSKKKKDKNAPHKPLNGYVLFLNENRARILLQNPDIEFPDVTKKLAAEWAQLSEPLREPYMKQAEKDRLRYRSELQAYKSTDAYRQFQESQSTPSVVKVKIDPMTGSAVVRKKPGPKPKLKGLMPAAQVPVKSTTADASLVTQSDVSSALSSAKSDIAIYTEDFLEHNKVREAELRKLRKLTTEFEEQNAILSVHIEKMRNAQRKLVADMEQMEANNLKVEQRLSSIRESIVSAFAHFTIPGLNTKLTSENVEQYIDHLHQWLVTSKSSENKENKLAQEKVRQILRQAVIAEDLELSDKIAPLTGAAATAALC